MIINFPLLGNAGGGGIDSAATQAMIDASLEGYYTSGETETAIDNKLGDYLSKVEYEPKELAISAALNQLNSDVQTISGNTPDMSLYTPTSNFSTINGSAITEGTNIVIEGGGSGTELLPVSEFPESAETGTLIAKTSITSIGHWEDAGQETSELDEQYFFFPDWNYTGEKVKIYEITIPDDNNTGETITLNVCIGYDDTLGKLAYYFLDNNEVEIYPSIEADVVNDSTSVAFDAPVEDPEAPEYYTIGTYETAYNGFALQVGKFDMNWIALPLDGTMITPGGEVAVDGIYQYDGTNWNKYEGGSASGSNIVELTQAEYDALATKDPNTLYIISDADSINMDNYALQTDLTALSNTVNTSLATKADAMNIDENSSMKFPGWNAQGIITGESSNNHNYTVPYINGTPVWLVKLQTSGDMPWFYAPGTAGNAGQPLLSKGTNNAPVWGTYKFAFLTETEYDALTTKETDTIYFVVPDPE